MRSATLALLLCVAAAAGGPGAARAQERAVGPTPPRLASLDGEVSFWRPGAEDWSPAQVNTPLAAGDALYTGDRGRFEVQLASRASVRAEPGTQLGIESLENGYLQLKVTSGRAVLDLERLPDGQRIEVDTPNAAFTIDRSGLYRVDVGDDTTFTTRRGGDATVVPAGGDASEVPDGTQVAVRGTDVATVSSAPAPAEVEQPARSPDTVAAPSRSARYLPRDVAGADDLDRAGQWRDTPQYGPLWVPNDVPVGWAPYSTGRWVWDPYYGWSWVDDAPWGWAPYHYGRWVHDYGYWGWAPGPVVSAAVYAPALVAFLGPVGVAVNVGFGLPYVGWLALGFGEPVLPWWGPVGFVGRPYWCGWGGPHVVNNVFINNTQIVTPTSIHTFHNMAIPHAVIGVRGRDFGRGPIQHVRLGPNELQHVQPIRGRLGVNPVAASLTPAAGHGRRPPDAIAHRAVVAMRAPQAPDRRLAGAGVTVSRAPGEPVPHLVRPSQMAHAPGHLRTFAGTPPPPRGSARLAARDLPAPRSAWVSPQGGAGPLEHDRGRGSVRSTGRWRTSPYGRPQQPPASLTHEMPRRRDLRAAPTVGRPSARPPQQPFATRQAQPRTFPSREPVQSAPRGGMGHSVGGGRPQSWGGPALAPPRAMPHAGSSDGVARGAARHRRGPG